MMQPLSLHRIADAIGSRHPVSDQQITSVTTDSRTAREKGLFVAIKGEHIDGHLFVDQALQAGATAAVVEREQGKGVELRVADSVRAYGQIASLVRTDFNGTVIGLTGSVGKTTTREMLKTILATVAPTIASQDNENNEIGVAHTLLRMQPEHRYAVVELGARKPGDIAWLTTITKPDIALITNIAASHLATFGDMDTVAATKGELFAGVSSHATAVVNGDDSYYPQLSAMCASNQLMRYSLIDSTADCYAAAIDIKAGGNRFYLHLPQAEAIAIDMQVSGRHFIENACAAALCAHLAGCTTEQIQLGLASFVAPAGRGQKIPVNQQLTVIDDCYNASPHAVRAAIDRLDLESGNTVLVLGDMLELGIDSPTHHQDIGQYAANKGIDILLGYGNDASNSVDAFCDTGNAGLYFDTLPALQQQLGDVLATTSEHVTVLVKGSRSMHMESIITHITGNTYAVSVK